jgi:hypothetical protein
VGASLRRRAAVRQHRRHHIWTLQSIGFIFTIDLWNPNDGFRMNYCGSITDKHLFASDFVKVTRNVD